MVRGARSRPGWRLKLLFSVLVLPAFFIPLSSTAEQSPHSLELSRPVRFWEFLPVVGTRAGLFGHENGVFEAWVYPLKLLRDFHLRFLVNGRILPAENLARTVIVRPESSTIRYSGDDFTMQETLFAPVNEPGAVVILDVQTSTSLQIEAAFQRDFQLEWPAALGGTYINWDGRLRAFVLGEEQKKYAAVVGSPSAVDHRQEFFTNYGSSAQNSFRLGVIQKGGGRQIIVLTGSMEGQKQAEDAYQRLSTKYEDLLKNAASYYRDYLDHTVRLELPDKQIQQAYDWSRVSMLQGLVVNPSLGTGLIAGYRTSGNDQRPGFAWFFGRDSFWTSLAFNAEGDFNTARIALDFVSKYQREDGKIPHEISQAAGLVPWFKNYQYAYASADATPLFIIAVDDYVRHSGDLAFAQVQWDRLWKAYEFLRSTYGSLGFAQNAGIGHGWVEGGPLLPVKTEMYQSGLGVEALRALADLAGRLGKSEIRRELEQNFAKQRPLLNQAFWSPEKKILAFALDQQDRRIEIPSILPSVPMWFGLADEDKAEAMIDRLADQDFETDWGARIISDRDPKYDPAGYHYGAVWPLFTGWASVAEYRYHRPLAGYESLRANSLLALDGSLGHVTEVLSGDYYQSLSTSSPHQIWSAAMVVSPIVRGMLGLEVDALSKQVRFAPHLPATWTSLEIRNIHVGSSTLQFVYRKTLDGITLQVTQAGSDKVAVEFAPALSLRAELVRAEMNNRPLAVHPQANAQDQHADVLFTASEGRQTIRIQFRNDFAIALPSSTLPQLGARSHGLRVTSEAWNTARDRLTLDISGLSSAVYELPVWNPGQITSVEGAELTKDNDGQGRLRVVIPQSTDRYPHIQIVIHFATKTRVRNAAQ